MSCMCGDIQCPSCGPAQGNSQCPICNAWMDDCCEHYEEYCETCHVVVGTDDEAQGNHAEACSAHGYNTISRLKPEYHAQAEAIARQQSLDDEAMAKDIEESERLAEEYWRNYRE